MPEMEESDCEPDSQGDCVDLRESTRYLVELESFDENLNSISANEVSQNDSSLISQASLGSQQSGFRKYPALNKIFRKDSREQTTCLLCNSQLKTREMDRLFKHVKKCKGLTEGDKLQVLSSCGVDQTMQKELKNNCLNESWARFMVENNVSFRCVDSESFKVFAKNVNSDWKFAHRHRFSTEYVPMISEAVAKKFYSTINTQENSISVEFDHWTDLVGRSFLGIIFTVLNGDRYLENLIDVSLEGHSSASTIPHLTEALSKLKTRTINSIVSDSAASCKLTRELIVATQDFKRLIQHRCMAHLVNRIGNLFGESEHINDTLLWASKVTAFISNSTKFAALLKTNGAPRPKRICNVRWYSTVNMVESLIKIKEPLYTTINQQLDPEQLEWIKNELMWTNLSRSTGILRLLANCIAVSERQTGTMSESVHCLMQLARYLFQRDWSDPLTVVAITCLLKYFGPSKLGEEEFGLMLASYALDRRNKCDYITEEGLDLIYKSIASVATKSGFTAAYTETFLLLDYSRFCAQKGELSRDQPKDMSALTWWDEISSSTGLKQIAMRILRLRSSSANIERTFSKLKWFQGDRRGNMSLATLTHLGRIKIFEGDKDIRVLEPTNLDKYMAHNQQLPEESDEDGDFDIGFDQDWFDHEQFGHLPELFDEDARRLWDTFCCYVDFSIVNQQKIDLENIQPELSAEQLDKLMGECRQMRQRVRSNGIHARAHQPETAAQIDA